MASRRRQRVDIYLLGRGIVDGVSQMTLEALDALRASRLVFDLSGDAKAIRKLHHNVIDLSDDYWTGELCDDVYSRLEETIVAEVRKNGPGVSVVVDGHPMLFDDVNWSLLRNGKRRRLNVVAIPGISCLDTMMIDVGADLGNGAQIVHVNQLLLYDITLDPHLQTYVLQIGKFGTDFFSRETKRNLPGRFTPLAAYLTRFYPADHTAILIVSLGAQSIRRRVRLGELDSARAFLHRHQDDGLTMYIPAHPRPIANDRFASAIDDLDHLKTIAELA
jgi:Tetrapyrrole (Corrin/Porphyrin) Methylases